jgi:hypothetical protein
LDVFSCGFVLFFAKKFYAIIDFVACHSSPAILFKIAQALMEQISIPPFDGAEGNMRHTVLCSQ